MTLQEFFNLLGENPYYLLAFFILIPFTAILAGWLGKDEGHLSPWKYLYASLIYLICIPGVFAVTLNIYLFLFERKPIYQTDIFTQILPIISMVATLLIIRNNVDLREIPGFGRLSGLVIMLGALFSIMWFLEKLHIYAITIVPFTTFLIVAAVILAVVIFGWKKAVRR